MGSCLLNLRIFKYHIQMCPWQWFRLSRNTYWDEYPESYKAAHWYEFY